MTVDFPLLLVTFTLVTGILWALDTVLWAPKRRAKADLLESSGADISAQEIERARREPYLIELSRSFFPIILIVLLVRSFVVEPFRIPSGSMMPTLLVGDFILVNKFAYGLRLPVLHTKIIDTGNPERGDVMVFRYPENPKIDYIKRVIGVPGDHVVYRNKRLMINGVEAPQRLIGTYVGEGSGSAMTGARHLQEDLLGIEHDILVTPGRNVFGGDFEYVVPEGQYFAMGDNRDNSRDSRAWGTVPEKNLVGKAFMIWMNWDWDKDSVVDWGRLGNTIE
ncbi:MAG: signal peptidase I [Gammaproteobacteria bacterium]|nr:signal peptidase I [Gammaproteobacteria bacterium]MCW8840978.1 signal peptidase I [Gammaproteobacteria bacterium]MCW8927443.1 signal peptidase I [Gammaproteobacteria bacterium]MCW8958721.1 signal peptidase I [Gammaproteobacteria bacterium]MCW8973255.1 signal peptidase I [Gammaproteobacteria bacterium]